VVIKGIKHLTLGMAVSGINVNQRQFSSTATLHV